LETREGGSSKDWKAAKRVVVRPAAAADLRELLRLDEALIAEDRRHDPTIDPAWTRSAGGRRFFRDRATGREGIGWVAEAGDHLAGYLVGCVGPAEDYRRVQKVAEIECLYVEPRWRGAGIGARLVRRFERWARRQGAERMRVVVSAGNVRAIRFYQRGGYRLHDVVLEKPRRGRSDRAQ